MTRIEELLERLDPFEVITKRQIRKKLPEGGEWDDEPDGLFWKDKATGVFCIVARNHGGALCGYAGVTKEHQWFRVNYSGDRDKPWGERGVTPECVIEAHGGLTFSDSMRGDSVWFFGFDCSHLYDLSPSHDRSTGMDTYRNLFYVVREVESMARQLAANSGEQPPEPQSQGPQQSQKDVTK